MFVEKWDHKYERKPGRWIFEPNAEYRAIGKKIKDATQKVWKAPRYFFHLRRGGHVKALQLHSLNTHFARFDIEDFFGRVSRNRVARNLKDYFSAEEAMKMANNSTVRHPTVKGRSILPYGFVQSPILASLSLAKSHLGTCLESLRKMPAMQVSVYVDDLIVSSNDLAQLTQACEALMLAAEKSHLPFNSAKNQGPAPAVTAFNIELTHKSLAIVAERLEEFALDLAAASGSEEKRKGIVGYVTSVNAAQAKKLTQ